MADVWANSMACHPRATSHIAGCCHLANSMSWSQSYVSHCRVLPPGEFNGMSSQSHVSHCCVLPLGEFDVMIPEPHATLHLAKSMSWSCLAVCNNSIRHAENRFSPYFILFWFFNAVWALTSGGFRIVSDTLVIFGSTICIFQACWWFQAHSRPWLLQIKGLGSISPAHVSSCVDKVWLWRDVNAMCTQWLAQWRCCVDVEWWLHYTAAEQHQVMTIMDSVLSHRSTPRPWLRHVHVLDLDGADDLTPLLRSAAIHWPALVICALVSTIAGARTSATYQPVTQASTLQLCCASLRQMSLHQLIQQRVGRGNRGSPTALRHHTTCLRSVPFDVSLYLSTR